MQVITGKFRGRKLRSVPTDQTRPTLGRVKESMFDLLSEYIYDKEVLDLFAGSGALGIECLSRGAKHVTFVDNQKESIKTIGQNLKNEFEGTTIILGDYEETIFKLARQNKKFDLVLLDPPFESDYIEKVLYFLHKKDLLNDHAIILCETSSQKLLQNYPQKYIIKKNKNYGTIMLTIFEYVKG